MMDSIADLEIKINESPDGTDRIDSMNNLAVALLEVDHRRALRVSKDATVKARQLQYTGGEIWALINCAKSYQNLQKPVLALQMAEKVWNLVTYFGKDELLPDIFIIMGSAHESLRQYDQSIHYYDLGLNESRRLKLPSSESRILIQLGQLHERLGDYGTALTNQLAALQICELQDDPHTLAIVANHIGTIYSHIGDFERVLEYRQKCLRASEVSGDKQLQALALNYIGSAYGWLEMNDDAFHYFRMSYQLREQIGDRQGQGMSLLNIGLLHGYLDEIEKAYDTLNQCQAIFDDIQDDYYRARTRRVLGDLLIRSGDVDKALTLLFDALNIAKRIGARLELAEVHETIAKAYKKQREFEKSLLHFEQFHQIDKDVFNEKSDEKVKKLTFQFEVEKAQQEAEIHRLKNVELARLNEEISAQKKIIESEKEKSEQLLLNVLPQKIVNELKETGTTEPEIFPEVSVLFTDFVGFTRMSSLISPRFLIDQLSELFSRFDDIIEHHACERIKTVGDAYLAVCGMPNPNPQHARQILLAAIDIIRYLNERNQRGDVQWEVRLGVHSGEVVGGVVGNRKYIYDVFGDTINTASRMEVASEPMKITVSPVTYKLVKDQFTFYERAPVEIKGKGQMTTYFLDVASLQNPKK